ncbi:MAG: hypothetical protein F9K43_07520 [Bauldia sp.]|nr:MAG: hypothetical protein F9K43_07520 [Bauldia sp.]
MTDTDAAQRKRERQRRWRKDNPDKLAVYAARRQANSDHDSAVLREWRSTNPKKVRMQRTCADASRRSTGRCRRYGLPERAFRNMLLAQRGRCAVCDAEFDNDRRVSIDHNHDTGAVRGLLCISCNSGIGSLGDSRDRLLAAAAYLKTTSGVDWRTTEPLYIHRPARTVHLKWPVDLFGFTISALRLSPPSYGQLERIRSAGELTATVIVEALTNEPASIVELLKWEDVEAVLQVGLRLLPPDLVAWMEGGGGYRTVSWRRSRSVCRQAGSAGRG